MAIGSTSSRQLLGAVNSSRKALRRSGPSMYGAQALSPVVQSAIRSNSGKETVHVAAVERIEETRPRPDRGVFKLMCRPIEFVEPRECGVEVCLVEYLAAVDQVAFERH